MHKKVYKKKESQKFFTKNGKILKSYQDYNSVISLCEKKVSDTVSMAVEKLAAEAEEVTKFSILKEKFAVKMAKIKQRVTTIKQMELPKISMISLGINAALLIAIVFLITSGNSSTGKYNKYSIFSSKPLAALASSTNLFGGDPRAATLDKIFGAYNCPLTGLGKIFVKEADKNDIPYWFTAAIAFQESSCGKITPKIETGEETYNAWGWGVWGKHVKSFANWEEGIAKVSEYLGNNFFSRGVTDTCEIMHIYTPPSDGSWCRGVNYFGDIIQNYKSPNN
jgi:hypothetical protein